jgi:hypothetical protein
MKMKTVLYFIFFWNGVYVYNAFIHVKQWFPNVLFTIPGIHKNNYWKHMYKSAFETKKEKRIVRNKTVMNDLTYFHQDYFMEENKPLIILVWYDCTESKQLIEEMERHNIKHVYIRVEELFDSTKPVFSPENMPLVYKDGVIIEDLFDIYSEIYSI